MRPNTNFMEHSNTKIDDDWINIHCDNKLFVISIMHTKVTFFQCEDFKEIWQITQELKKVTDHSIELHPEPPYSCDSTWYEIHELFSL